jgi:FkbM family methyltransferase
LKNLFKKLLEKTAELIVNLLGKFNAGRYVLDQFNNNISNIIISVPNKKSNLRFYSPNRLNHFRINTFFSKEPETLEWIDNFEKDSVFYDIGANIGLYSCYAAEKKNCKVLAFEPSVFNLDLLSKNISLNSLSKSIIIITIPMSNNTKIAEFNMSNTLAGGALSTFGETYIHDGTEMEKIFTYNLPGTNLDNIIKFFNLPKPQYIKIDVDGIEHLILDGANDTLNNINSILVEVNDKFKLQSDKIKKILTNKGFTLENKEQSQLIKEAENKEVQSIFNQIWIKKK